MADPLTLIVLHTTFIDWFSCFGKLVLIISWHLFAKNLCVCIHLDYTLKHFDLKLTKCYFGSLTSADAHFDLERNTHYLSSELFDHL